MPRPTLAELKQTLRQREAKRYRRERQGEVGEKWAAEYLSLGVLPFEPIDAGKYDKPEELARRGGKRADFIVESRDAVVLLDAKHHQTRDCTWFGLPEEEIFAFQRGQEFIQEFMTGLNDARTLYTYMMVFPEERKGTRLTFVSLSELVEGGSYLFKGEPWRGVDLTKMVERWDDHQPVAKPAYD